MPTAGFNGSYMHANYVLKSVFHAYSRTVSCMICLYSQTAPRGNRSRFAFGDACVPRISLSFSECDYAVSLSWGLQLRGACMRFAHHQRMPALLAQGMLTQPVNVARAIAAATAIGRPADATSGAVAEFTGEALGPSDASAAQVASAVGKGQALDAVRSIKLQSVALAATAAVEGGQGEQAHAPSSVKP